MKPWQTAVRYGAIALASVMIFSIAFWGLRVVGFILGLASLGTYEEAKVYSYDYATCLSLLRGEFDLIFIDPPYALDIGVKALETVGSKGLLSENGVAVFERDRPFEYAIEGLEKYDERKYGKAWLSFFRRKL